MSNLIATPFETFRSATVTAARLGMTGPGQLGSRLAWAAARTLHARAADITFTTGHTHAMPWGASHHTAAVAEQYRFTAGSGPSTCALSTGRPIHATGALIERSWPALAAVLAVHTPYRSMLIIPVAGFAVLSVYYSDPDGCTNVDSDATADLVASLVTISLIDDPELQRIDDHSSWPYLGGLPRTQVPVAVGILTSALRINSGAALAVLRARTFTTDRTIDDIAADIVEGRDQSITT